MSKIKPVFVAILVVSAFLVPGAMSVPQANAASPIIIRFASLAPPGSGFMKVMKAWNRSLKEATENRVELRFYSGGSQGDERDFIRKVRAGQMDAAGVTTTGLGMVARPVLVLTAPGVITEYEQLERARTALGDRFSKLFDDGGFIMLAWGEAGKNRLFSMEKFAKPDDLKALRPWAWKDDPVFAAYVTTIGANPVRVGVPEVYGGLQTRMLDTVPSSALGAVALQWYTRLNYMAKDNLGILIDTSERAARANDTLARRDDNRAYDSLIKRGMIEVDTSAYRAEWDAVAKQTRESLTGRVYSKSLLEAVEKAVADN
jgi:TRAP-type C4-dicarboxylate transport system substrate-binding protein